MIFFLILCSFGVLAFISWIAYDCGYDDGWNDRHNLNKGHAIRDIVAVAMANFILRHVASPWYRDMLDKLVRDSMNKVVEHDSN